MFTQAQTDMVNVLVYKYVDEIHNFIISITREARTNNNNMDWDGIEKMNIAEVSEILRDLIFDVEYYHENITSIKCLSYIRSYTDWREKIFYEKDDKKLSPEQYEEEICNYVDFLRTFCLKYNIYVSLTEDEQIFLEKYII